MSGPKRALSFKLGPIRTSNGAIIQFGYVDQGHFERFPKSGRIVRKKLSGPHQRFYNVWKVVLVVLVFLLVNLDNFRYDGVSNVLFHDYTQKLRGVPTVKNTDNMILPFDSVLAKERICYPSSNSSRTSIGIVLVFLLFMLNINL